MCDASRGSMKVDGGFSNAANKAFFVVGRTTEEVTKGLVDGTMSSYDVTGSSTARRGVAATPRAAGFGRFGVAFTCTLMSLLR